MIANINVVEYFSGKPEGMVAATCSVDGVHPISFKY